MEPTKARTMNKHIEQIPQSKLARSGIAGATAVKIGMTHLGHKMKRPFMSEDKHKAEKELLDDKNAERLFKALTQLRGTALKVGQFLGMEMDIMPERFRKELEKSFHQVPPLNRVLVRKVLIDEFGQPPESLFASFDNQAFAAASLGQVHRATLPDGTKVAVKIQYPGIHTTIDNDLKLIKTLARGMPDSTVIIESLDEIKTRLLEEVDYKLEAENTEWFRQQLKLDFVYVPRVYSEYSSQRVLTTEYIEGKHLNNWLADKPSQLTRNRAAQNLEDLLIHSSLTLYRLHADPNPGNYLFHEDGSVTLIDFGCVKRLSKNFVDIIPRLNQAYYDDDPNALFAEYKKLGMFHEKEGSQLYEEVLRPFGQWLTLSLQETTFDFGKHSDYTSSGRKVLHDISSLSGLNHIADEFIFFDRTIYGLCKIFERMEAQVEMKKYWIKD